MDSAQQDFESIRKQLSGIKLWLAVGAIGFLLIGIAAVVFSISMTTMMNVVEDEYEGSTNESDVWDKASGFFERGEKEKLLDLVNERLKTHPNDAQVYWYRAKVYILDEVLGGCISRR